MAIPTIKRCLCFDLRFGSFIIACVQLAYAVVGLLDAIQLASTDAPEPRTTPGVASFKFSDGTGNGFFVVGDFSDLRKFMRMYVWLHIAETLGLLIITSLLVHGIRNKRKTMFVPWLGVHFLTTVLFGIMSVVVPLGTVVEFGTELTGIGLAAGLACLFAFVLNGYITLVVYSHFRELGVEAKARRFAPVEIELCVPQDQLPPSYDDVVKPTLTVKQPLESSQ